MFDAVSIIGAKRDGRELSGTEIDWIVQAFTQGIVGDEQMSALAMAIYFRGMSRAETGRWTEAMIESGGRMDFSDLPLPTVDKHSTGGVGDKITLPLAPLVAACGLAVPQLSGRGLGHTGGTLDKLEAIPGYSTRPDPANLRKVVREIGTAIIGQTDDLAPPNPKGNVRQCRVAGIALGQIDHFNITAKGKKLSTLWMPNCG